MVLLHVKRSDKDTFLFDTPAATTPGAGEEEGGEEPSDFHAEFVKRLREQTQEVAEMFSAMSWSGSMARE